MTHQQLKEAQAREWNDKIAAGAVVEAWGLRAGEWGQRPVAAVLAQEGSLIFRVEGQTQWRKAVILREIQPAPSRAARISAASGELRAAQMKEEEASRAWEQACLEVGRAKREYLEIVHSTGATDGE